MPTQEVHQTTTYAIRHPARLHMGNNKQSSIEQEINSSHIPTPFSAIDECCVFIADRNLRIP